MASCAAEPLDRALPQCIGDESAVDVHSPFGAKAQFEVAGVEDPGEGVGSGDLLAPLDASDG